MLPEPTVVPPVLLDLCTVAILHRFSSPSVESPIWLPTFTIFSLHRSWWEHLSRHVSADVSADDAFDKVVRLQVRQIALNAHQFFVTKLIPS